MSFALPPGGGSSPGVTAPFGAPAHAPVANELAALPAPRHLHEYLTRSQHLHFGYFEGADETVAQAQDRLVARALRHVPRMALVADVGCGLGGAVNLIAASGHRVYGFDPCAASIGFARGRTTSPRAQLLVCDLAQFAARARGARFDALFAYCRALLRPGGTVIVHDVVRLGAAAPGAPASPPRGALRLAADAAGFDLLEARDLSNRVVPTLSRLLRQLTERRDELARAFGDRRTDVHAEIEDYLARLRALEHAFARAELAYEGSVLRCSTRFGTDSVVMRVPARTEVVPAPRRS
jgi:cyclopropane fatty-acyl-phospholipid synthase-like methyltransferase